MYLDSSNLLPSLTVDAPNVSRHRISNALRPTDTHRQPRKVQGVAGVQIDGCVDGVVQYALHIRAAWRKRDVGVGDGNGNAGDRFVAPEDGGLLGKSTSVMDGDPQHGAVGLLDEGLELREERRDAR